MSKVPQVKTKRTREASQRSRLGTRQLEALIEEAIIDAYGESEQRVGFLTMLEEYLAIPFATEILGTVVRVGRVDLNGADEIVAICRRGHERQMIPLPAISRRFALLRTAGRQSQLRFRARGHHRGGLLDV
jgi:hypothetical protein